MRILEHFFPGHELNLQSLRTIAKAIKDGSFSAPPVQHAEGLFTQDQFSPEEAESVDDGEEQDVNELHEPLGCMMKDSGGRFDMSALTARFPSMLLSSHWVCSARIPPSLRHLGSDSILPTYPHPHLQPIRV
jgi:hypothetical protein